MLLVDDTPFNLTCLEMIVKGIHPNCTILTAADGQEAVELVLKQEVLKH
jgi:CheY-like chemotaxis protein